MFYMQKTINLKLLWNYKLVLLRRKWSSLRSSVGLKNKKLTSKHKALDYFDDFYGQLFKKQWPSMRLALLSSQKYIAVVNNFSDNERIQSYLENLGGINIDKLLKFQAAKLNEIENGNTEVDKDSNRLERKIQQYRDLKENEELTSIYPNGEHINRESSKIPSADGRLIEPSLGLSAPALSEYIPASTLVGMENWIPESKHYSYYAENQDNPINVIEQDFIDFPPHLHAYTFEIGNVERFPSPKKGSIGTLDYYLLNGGSLLPVLALDVKPGDNILDMCAAPGGKSLLCLQTLYPRTVVLNDLTESRINKINVVMKEYFYNLEDRKEKGEIIISQFDGRLINLKDSFDKILVDVPCTTDRLSVNEDDNNIFKSGRTKERIKIPELQSELLINALKIVKVNGTVVYSTCSLSPTQNDGVVALALRKLSEQCDNKYIVIDMTKALEPTTILFSYGKNMGLKCGHLVIPYLPANFGPTYFCKIIRIK